MEQIDTSKSSKGFEASKFLGITKKRAYDLAEAHSLILRLIQIDEEKYFDIPEDKDFVKDRICIKVKNGVVSEALFK